MKKLICDKDTITLDNITFNHFIVAIRKNIEDSIHKDILVGKLKRDGVLVFVNTTSPSEDTVYYKIDTGKGSSFKHYNYDIYTFINEQEYFRFLAETLNYLALTFDMEYGP